MGARKNEVVLTFAGDSVGLDRTVDQVGNKLTRFQGTADSVGGRLNTMSDKFTSAGASMRQMGGRATAFISLPLVAAFGAAQQASSNLAEAQNATNVVFTNASPIIDEAARTAATSMGLSERAFREAVTPMGAMLQNLGFTQGQAANQSVNLAERAADMASVFNTDVSTALDAINAGLRGESDPLEQFGVGMSAAAVEAKALEMGLKDQASELTDNDKAWARYNLLMDQTNDIAGDFANTADQTANKQRIMKAEAENAAAAFGNNLQPVMDKLLGVAGGLLEKFNGLTPAQQNFIMYAGLALIALGPLVTVIGTLATVIGFLLSPIGLVILAIAGLVAAGYLLYRNWDTIKTFAADVWGSVQEKISGVFNWVKTNWPLLLAILTGPIGLAVLAISRNWGTIKAGATAVKDWIVGKWNAVVSFVTGLPGRISAAASGMWDGIKTAFKNAINQIIGWWNGLQIPGISISQSMPGPIPDISVSAGPWNLPNIPYLHTGGTFEAPRGQREGLAMLLDGETVSRPGAGSGLTVNVYVAGSIRSDRDLVRVIRDELDRGGLGGLR
jgi:hypothetical protein